MRKPQVIPDEDHAVMYERVAAVDVAKASGVVCMRTPDPARPGRYLNRVWEDVTATRARITELGLELLANNVQMVTLESTSDYWRIWFYVLEGIGLAVMAEIPMVVINVQRGGPSTGQPTKGEQGDLLTAVFGSHGDAPKVVIAEGARLQGNVAMTAPGTPKTPEPPRSEEV